MLSGVGGILVARCRISGFLPGFLQAERNDFDYRLAYIPPAFDVEPREEFDP